MRGKSGQISSLRSDVPAGPITVGSSLPTLKAGVGLAAEELAGTGAADEFAGVAAGEDGLGGAFDLDAFKHGIVHAHVVGFGADDFFVVGIEDHHVGVGA